MPERFNLRAGGNPDLEGDIRQRDAMKDKLSIVLNIAGTDFYYMGDGLEMWQWYREVGKIALATGDPFVLCATGPQLFADGEPTWLHLLSDADNVEYPRREQISHES
jgi:hypothetical protein